MSSKAAQDFQDLITSYIGKLFLEDLASDCRALEEAAMKAVCACRYYELFAGYRNQSQSMRDMRQVVMLRTL